MHALLQRLDQLALRVGHASAWLSLALVLVTVTVVGLRYGFNQGSIALQETALYLHGALFMLGMSYTLARDEHVRVDIFYRRMTPERRALVDLVGTLALLAPLCITLLVLSWDYVLVSWQRLEGSADAGGLPLVFVLKSLLLAMPALLLVQALAEGLRAWLRWQGHAAARADDGEGQGWS
ncbi:MAG: TRAP transporter small permease subunit [Alcanivoracaceae bacterium]|nr:TRAP transporter small permease subunit [Alcanivoracaceae bacterium]